MAGAISFQGLSTNLPTDQLVAAIINQESQPMVRMQTKQTTNTQEVTSLQTLSVDLLGLNSSLTNLVTGGLTANTVATSDSANTYVSATASGAVAGVYDVAVKSLASRARAVIPTAMMPNAAVGKGTYSITDLDGKSANITIDDTNNSLAGLASAINNAKITGTTTSLNVNASIIQTGAGGASQLVLSANNTGTGASGASTFSLQMAAGSTLDPSSQGTFTSTAGTNSDFFLNGVELTRASNTITDAVQGVTFTLNKAQTNLDAAHPELNPTTTMTVGMDSGAASSAMQAVVTSYNQFYNDYANNAKFTRNADGTYTTGVFNMDMTVRNMVNQVSTALMAPPTGLPSTAALNTPAAVGLKTNQDGTLSLDTTAFVDAFKANPQAVTNLFGNSGSSTSPLLSFVGSTNKTTTSPIDFQVSKNPDGSLTGNFTTKDATGKSATYTLTSNDGSNNFYGVSGTPLEGLTVNALAGAQGTLNVSTGISTSVQTLNSSLSDLNAGSIGGLISSLNADNFNLQNQINSQQAYLDQSKTSLQKTYSNLEMTVGQMQSAGQSLSTLA